jgi:hypothetical protein
LSNAAAPEKKSKKSEEETLV